MKSVLLYIHTIFVPQEETKMNYKKAAAIVLSILLSVTLLATGCSHTDSGQSSKPGNSGGNINPSADDGRDVVGVISSIGVDYYIIQEYTAVEPIEDYASVSLGNLVPRKSNRKINVTGSTSFFKAENGELVSVLPTTLKTGALVARTTAEDGKVKIILIEAEFGESTTADVAGQVIGVVGAYISVNLYHSPGVVKDYTTFDLNSLMKIEDENDVDNWQNGFIYLDLDAVDMEGDSFTKYYIIENGELKEYAKENIKQGDIVVGTDGKDGIFETVIVLQKNA
jgi:hypothetical protein